MRSSFPVILALGLLLLLAPGRAVQADDAAKPARTLFTNARVFDGVKDGLSEPTSVLVVGNKIEAVGADASKEGATVIDCGGMTLMPGLIDAHTHFAFTREIQAAKNLDTPGDIALRAAEHARRALYDGFTTARDLGGDVFAVKRAIDAGLIEGPRIYPSGAFISQTSGHGDFGDASRPNTAAGVTSDQLVRLGFSRIADGVPDVLKAVRQNLRQGATQIKVMGGGGGSSPWDPIDTTQYSEAEWRAAVEAAADWGTYVTTHIFTDRAVKRAVTAGVKCLDHAFFMSEDVIKMCAAKGVFVAPQMWGVSPELFNNPNVPKSKHAGIRDLQKTYAPFASWLLKHKVKVCFASDILGPFDNGQLSRRYELYYRTVAFKSNYEVLKQATSVPGELLMLSGPRNPYPGKLGVIEKGAFADILVVQGNPLEDIFVLGASKEWFKAPAPKPVETLRVIMKDGRIYKNTLK